MIKKNELYQPYRYNRRDWLQLSSLAVGAICIPDTLSMDDNQLSYQYYLAQIETTSFSLPANKTAPFDWPVAEVPVTGNSLVLHWNKKPGRKNRNMRFRITSATDVREECTLEISLALSQQKIGVLDIRYAHYMQPFEIPVSSDLMTHIVSEGIVLKMIKGTKPFWFFARTAEAKEIPDAYLPHLLVYGQSVDAEAWKKRLLSLASLSTFGWMEGCVLDGIHTMESHDKNAAQVLQQHLDKYFAGNTLLYQNLYNLRSAEKINTVESILPFAILALRNPQHHMLQKAIDFCMAHSDAAGVVADELGENRRLKTEECYTISYPLSILAVKLNRPELEKMAIANLEARVKLLANNDFIYQNSKELETPVFGNWARGVAWYLLGLAKTLAVLKDKEETKMLIAAFQKGAELVMRYQQTDGLWTCFLHEPETAVETSGSAGIAAALAYGYAHKLLGESSKAAAEKCLRSLRGFYTPDGFLTGTAQVNKGGPNLQRNGFRVISPYTLGFIGILETSLDKKNK